MKIIEIWWTGVEIRKEALFIEEVMVWLLLRCDKQLTVLNFFLVPRIGIYNFEVQVFFLKKDANNPQVKEKNLYA